ncbi:NAC transcription factor 32-like [Primulina huaijiensis]|uniref:NAC transcription factor 32-like n=1 Tax=Primulina huaijiensis TaxID=1492673 RepID=UPI003CC72DDC
MGETQELDLPLGFRFHPTEFELYDYYLIPKFKGEPLDTNLIMSLDVYRYDPWQLPLDQLKYARENEGHFFTQSIEQGTSARATPSGNWIISKENIPICRENEVIGFKNKFLFSNGNEYPIDGDQIAYWKMVEYRCNPAVIITSNKEMENLVICKVRHKTRVEEDPEEEDDEFEY